MEKHTFKCPICGGKSLLHEVKVVEKRSVEFSDDGTMKLSNHHIITYISSPEVYRCIKCNERYTLPDVEAIMRGQYESIIMPADIFKALLAQGRSCIMCKYITDEYRCGRTGEYAGFDLKPCKFMVFSDIAYGGNISDMCTECMHAKYDSTTYRWSCAKEHNMYEKSVLGECEDH